MILFMLLLLFVQSNEAYAFEALSDTIIIDNKTLIVEREIVYDTLSTPQEQEPIKEKEKTPFWLELNYLVGASFNHWSVNSASQELKQVDDFVGRSWRTTFDSHISLNLGLPIADNDFFVVGLGLKKVTVSNTNFNVAELSDSLYQFESPTKGDLFQVELFRFEKGQEINTLPIALEDQSIRQTRLSLYLGYQYDHKLSQTESAFFGGGLTSTFNVKESNSDVIALNENAEYVIWSSDQVMAKQFTFSPLIYGGFKTKPKRNSLFSATFGAYFQGPSRQVKFTDNELVASQWSAGLRVGLNFFFDR